jgi:hypothetical protein
MINWSFHKLSLIAQKLSLINSSGILGVYKSFILIGLLLSLSIIITTLVVSSPLIITLFIPLYILNFCTKSIKRVFKKEYKTRSKLLALGDTKELDACQELLEICQVEGQLKLGLFKDSPCVYKILYLECDSELIGFVEFFSRIGQEE